MWFSRSFTRQLKHMWLVCKAHSRLPTACFSCWLATMDENGKFDPRRTLLWSFLLPVAVLLFFNTVELVYFSITAVKEARRARRRSKSKANNNWWVITPQNEQTPAPPIKAPFLPPLEGTSIGSQHIRHRVKPFSLLPEVHRMKILQSAGGVQTRHATSTKPVIRRKHKVVSCSTVRPIHTVGDLCRLITHEDRTGYT